VNETIGAVVANGHTFSSFLKVLFYNLIDRNKSTKIEAGRQSGDPAPAGPDTAACRMEMQLENAVIYAKNQKGFLRKRFNF
jgi:hypothetical protein